jgi:PAS domain S-box-containing protein
MPPQSSESLFADVPSPEDALNCVLNNCLSSLAADRCALFLKDPKCGDFLLKSSIGLSEKYLRVVVNQWSKTPTARMFQEPRFQFFPDAMTDPRLESWRSEIEAEGYRSMVSVPLPSEENPIGVLALYFNEIRDLSKEDQSTIWTFAKLAAIAVENARLYFEAEKRSTNLEVLNEISKTINATLDLAELFRLTVEQVKRVIPCDRSSLYLIDPKKKVITDFCLEGGDKKIEQWIDSHRELAGSHIEGVLTTGTPVSIPDTRKESHPRCQSLASQGLLSLLNVPVIREGECIAVFNLGSTRVNAFTKEHTELLQSVTDHMAVAIKNAEVLDGARESKERLDNLVQSAADAIVTVDLDGQITSWNPAAEEIYGYSKDEVLKEHVSVIFPRGDKHRQEFTKAKEWLLSKATGGITSWETLRRRKDGSLIEVAISISPIKDSKGRVTGLMGISRDIGSKKQVAEALRTSEARTHAILAAAPTGIVTFDEKGRIDSFNPTAEQMFGMTAVEVIGHSIGSLLQGPDAKKFLSYLDWYTRTGETQLFALSHELTGRRKDGRGFSMDMTLSEINLEDARIFTGIIRDLTDQSAGEALIHGAQKLETIGLLAGEIAEDFSNLLTFMQGHIMLALTGMKPDDPGFQHLFELSQAADRACELVAKLRKLDHTPLFNKKVTELKDEFQSVLDLLDVILPDSIEIERSISPESCSVEADPALIQDLMINLCLNARDAMPEGGRLNIGLDRVLLEPGHPDLDESLDPGEYACIWVRDTGTGMSEEVQGQIFEPFFTTKERGKGSGLGLPTVMRTVKDHNGFINFESIEGEGTTFWVYLPLAKTDTTELSDFSVIHQHPQGNGECILVVDDEQGVLDLIGEILESFGYQVLTAQSGNEAVELFRVDPDRVDLVLMDVVMPGLSGREAFTEIRKLQPSAKVIFATANSVAIPEAVQASGAAFIGKPYSLEELLAGIRQMLDRRRGMTDSTKGEGSPDLPS